MTINVTAYDTTSCASFAMQETVDEIKRAQIAGSVAEYKVKNPRHDTFLELLVVQGGNSFADAVHYFRHPILVDTHNKSAVEVPQASAHSSKVFAVDVREFGKWNTPTHQFQVRNSFDYAWQLQRAVLNQTWLDGRPEVLRDLSNLPAAAYSALISECVARRFALNPSEQMTVTVLAAYFYYSLFTDEEAFSDVEKTLLAGKISQITNVPHGHVESLLSKVSMPYSLADLVIQIKGNVDNVALDSFNTGTLLSVVCSTWIGYNARENVGVALEHVPTWLMIVASSLGLAAYRRTPLAKIVQRFDKAQAGMNFLRSLELVMGGPSAVLNREGVDPIYAQAYSNYR